MSLTKVTNSMISGAALNALDYGLTAGVGNGSNNTTALNTVTAAAIAAKAGIVIPAGYYEFPTNWNAITATGQSIQSIGGVAELHFTGTGVAVTLGQASTNIYNCVFGGSSPIRVTGTAACTDTILIRRMATSNFNVWVANCTGAGVRVTFTVESTIRVVCNANTEPTGVYLVTPTNGIVVTNITVGEYTTTTNVVPIIQGTSGAGIVIDSAQYMSISGGASEGCGKGITLSANSRLVSITGTDFETNTTSNIEDSGSSNSFFNVSATQSSKTLFNGTATKIFGGQYRFPTLSASSKNIGFFGVGFASGATLVPSTGTYLLSSCYLYDGNGVYLSPLLDSSTPIAPLTWSPVLSSSGGGTQGASTSTGYYFTVGQLCYCTGNISVDKGTLAAGTASISLPLQISSYIPIQNIALGAWDSIAVGATYSYITLNLVAGQQNATLVQSGRSTTAILTPIVDLPSTVTFRFSGVYQYN